MGEKTGIWLRQEALDLGLPLVHTAIISMAINMPHDLHASNRSIANMLNTSIRTIIRTVSDLQNKGIITISGNTSSRVIKANMAYVEESNYSQYGLSTTANMAPTTANMSKTTANMADNNKDIKDNRVYKKVTPSEKQEYQVLAKLLMTLHQVVDSKFIKTSSQLNKWAVDIRKLAEIDKRNLEEIEEIIRWAKRPDCFWFPNILSGKKLREKADTLISQMKRDTFKVIPKDEVKNKNYAEGWS